MCAGALALGGPTIGSNVWLLGDSYVYSSCFRSDTKMFGQLHDERLHCV